MAEEAITADGLRPIRLCRDCDMVADRKVAPRFWLCLAHPKAPQQGFVTDQYHEKEEPYGRCSQMNLGFCPLWTPKRDGQMQLGGVK